MCFTWGQSVSCFARSLALYRSQSDETDAGRAASVHYYLTSSTPATLSNRASVPRRVRDHAESDLTSHTERSLTTFVCLTAPT